MRTSFFPITNVAITAHIQMIHITYLILSRFPCFAGLLFIRSAHSWSPPAGQRYPHHTLPKNIEKTSIAAKTIKLPLITCSIAALMIRYGEKYHIVIGKRSNDINRIVFLILCRITVISFCIKHISIRYICLIYYICFKIMSTKKKQTRISLIRICFTLYNNRRCNYYREYDYYRKKSLKQLSHCLSPQGRPQ